LKYSQAGDLAMLISPDKKRFIFHLKTDGEIQTHKGILRHNDLIDCPWGSKLESHSGKEFTFFEPSLRDILMSTKRQSQIIYPKDIGYILLRLSVGPGKTVIEAGTGSGGLTTALAWSVGAEGKVFSYDRREDMQNLARRNLGRIGLEERVVFHNRDLEDGFTETDVDALFLDVPNPHDYIEHVKAALSNGGTFGVILPTTNQVSLLLTAMHRIGFADVEICEILLRFYKANPQRLRPDDRMIGHTGFLIFARLEHRIASPDDMEFTSDKQISNPD
jgi:tRNA (adenine57-N1/adenine58-N1)-methyltransferase catalytic subunit